MDYSVIGFVVFILDCLAIGASFPIIAYIIGKHIEHRKHSKVVHKSIAVDKKDEGE